MNTLSRDTQRVLIAVAIAARVAIAWWLIDIFMLVFGGVDVALAAAGQGLERWLLGQLFSMRVIGTLTTIGLYLLVCHSRCPWVWSV
jgi:hypothetical protein